MKVFLIPVLLLCCQFTNKPPSNLTTKEIPHENKKENNINSRFSTPDNFSRTPCDSQSFAFYLRNLNLKPEGTLVKYYTGETKAADNIYLAVVDMEISAKDLQQCADAVMRLRGEYLYKQKRFQDIQFRFLGDGKMHKFIEYSKGDTSYIKFRKYMDHVFNFANTTSLYQQLKPKPYYKMEIGDVFIQTGQPYGHALIVTDMCKNSAGDFKYILAQSYMPAQETQILLKPGSNQPWFDRINSGRVITHQWTFDTSDLRTWQ